MDKYTLILLCLSVFTSLILLYMFFDMRRERNFYKNLERKTAEQLRNLRSSFMSDGKMKVLPSSGTVEAYEQEIKEFAALTRRQDQMIMDLRRLLKASQERNKANKRLK